MSTNLKWLASTGSAAQILNLTLNCDHFRPHDPQGQGRQRDQVNEATEAKATRPTSRQLAVKPMKQCKRAVTASPPKANHTIL
jgi:hypothetical protein